MKFEKGKNMTKLVIATICGMFLVSDLHTMNVELADDQRKKSDTPTVKKLPIIKRSDSRIRLFELENKELLPNPMSTEEYRD